MMCPCCSAAARPALAQAVTRLVASLGWVACALFTASGAAPAQSSGDLFAQGLRAYRNLEFEVAAGLLRREAARLVATGAPATDRAKALVYLGAADLFRGRRDSAAAVFRRLIVLDPRYRPDQLVFPPDVTAVFENVRQATKTVLLVPSSPDTVITPGAGSWSAWLIASSFHTVEVTLRYEDGGPFRRLYDGPIGDSLNLRWDGLDPAGAPPAISRLLLRIASRSPTGQVTSIVQVPLALRANRLDTLPWPAPPAESLFLPERATSRTAMRALAGGMLLSGAVVALPAVVGGRETSSGPRVAVAGTLGLAGLVGFIAHRPGRPLRANIHANQERRAPWQQRLAAVKAENVRRAGDISLAIRTGEPTPVPIRGP